MALAPTRVYPPVSFEVGAFGVDLIAALEVTLVDAPLLQVGGIGSLPPRRRPAGRREGWRARPPHPRTPRGTRGHGEGDRVGGHARRLTLSGGPGKGLGRSRKHCPRCRCSCPWGTWSPGQFSLVGGGKEKLLRNKEGGGEACEQRTETHPQKPHPYSQCPKCCSTPPPKIKLGRWRSPLHHGAHRSGGTTWGGTPFGCLLLLGGGEIQPSHPG